MLFLPPDYENDSSRGGGGLDATANKAARYKQQKVSGQYAKSFCEPRRGPSLYVCVFSGVIKTA